MPWSSPDPWGGQHPGPSQPNRGAWGEDDPWGRQDPRGRWARPMTLADVLDGTFRMIVEHWRTYLLAVGGVLVPLTLLTSVVLAAAAPELVIPGMFDPEALDPQVLPTGLLAGAGLAAAISVLITTPVTYSVCAVVAREIVAGRTPDPGTSLREGARRYLPVLGVVLLYLVGVLAAVAILVAVTAATVAAVGEAGLLVVLPLGLLLLIVGTWVGTRLSLAIPVAVVERTGPLRGFGRSWLLTRTRFWPLLGTLLLVQIIAAVVGGIIAIPLQLLAAVLAFQPFLAVVVATLGSVASTLVTTPVPVNALVLLHLDRRVRREGADLLAT